LIVFCKLCINNLSNGGDRLRRGLRHLRCMSSW